MTAFGFYKLDRSPLESALPRLLERVVERDLRALVLATSQERVESLDALLWTYKQRSFLAHGTARDGHADAQPIFLTTAQENPNAASVLVLVDGAEHDRPEDFERCLLLFDGKDEAAVADARERWSAARDAGHEVVYWRQTRDGQWQRAGD